jgi:hypothetical protein
MGKPPDDAAAPRRNDSPERRLQSFSMHYIEAAVLQPMIQNSVRNESRETMNARARAKAAGQVAGWPDHQVFQLGPSLRVLMIEFKTDTGVVSERQEAVHAKLRRLSIPVAVCRSVVDVFLALTQFGFSLHGNAKNMAVEAQARLEGRHRAAALKGPRQAGKPRRPRPTAARLRFAGIYAALGRK